MMTSVTVENEITDGTWERVLSRRQEPLDHTRHLQMRVVFIYKTHIKRIFVIVIRYSLCRCPSRARNPVSTNSVARTEKSGCRTQTIITNESLTTTTISDSTLSQNSYSSRIWTCIHQHLRTRQSSQRVLGVLCREPWQLQLICRMCQVQIS